MSDNPVQTQRKEGYAILTVSRPKALNALNTEVLEGLHAAVTELSRDAEVRALILTGDGPKAFVAGADVAVMQNMKEEEAARFAEAGHRTMNAISQAELISVAAINGFALGGGLELALACDLRLAARSARMGLPEVTLGLIPGFGGTQRLPRVIGKGLALEMILSGDMVTADRAYEMGLVNQVHEDDVLLTKAEEFVQRLIAHKSGVAQRAARWAVQSGLDMPLQAGLEREIRFFGELFSGSDPKTGITAFLNKEKPEFSS